MRARILPLLILSSVLSASAAPRCPSGTLLGDVRFSVRPQGSGDWRPVRDVNLLPAGHVLRYEPNRLAGDSPEKARLALIFVPSDNRLSLEITGVIPAKQWAEWAVPFRTAAVGVVFGPAGLDHKKVRNLVRDDKELIGQLAEYAEKSTQAEKLMQALAAYDHQPTSQENLEAALTGFAASWRVPVSRLDARAPADQQAATLLRTLNPALASYDPLSQRGVSRYQQTAGLAAVVASLFFGNTVGLAAGSASLFLNMKTMLFPDTDFRTSFLQSEAERQVMCAPRETGKPRTRLAYLWAVKVPDAEPPALALEAPLHLGAGVVETAALRPPALTPALLLRARNWRLLPRAGDSPPLPVRVLPVSAAGKPASLSVEISCRTPGTGEYQLQGDWDWAPFQVEGTVVVHPLDQLGRAVLLPESRDRLITGTGIAEIAVTGAGFRFVRRAELRSSRAKDAIPVPLAPTGPEEETPDTTLRLRVDTTSLPPGAMTLHLFQQDGQSVEIPVRILPAPPRLEQVPLRVNLGETEQILTLRGQGLERLQKLATPNGNATLELLDGSDTQRSARIRLSETAQAGDRLSLLMEVEGMHDPIVIDRAIHVANPRPRLAAVQASQPPESFIETRENELLAGVPRSFLLQVSPAAAAIRLHLGCEDPALNISALDLRSGQQNGSTAWQPAGPGRYFLSLEPGTIGAPGCRLQVTVSTPEEGSSDPFPLGEVVRAPRIEQFEITDRQNGSGLYVAHIEGYDLDTIQQAGWTPADGYPVVQLPAPVPGQSNRQTLEIQLPWPAPTPRAPLYVFLQGETTGRKTQARL